jgi:2,7-dihydroxy-5-methyl-1-naphthoate 7-O-methyltransferase
VLVIESSHDVGSGNSAGFAEMNLRMLVLTAGRERTLDDYTTLVAEAGLEITAVHHTMQRHVVIECAPEPPAG